MNKTILIFSGLILLAANAKSGSTGAQFLKIDTDARVSGMAAAGVAAVHGINALAYNPAGMAGMAAPELAFSHTKWLMDSNHDYVGFGMPVTTWGRKTNIGLGVTRLSSGKFEGRADDGSANGGYSSYEQAVSLGFGLGNIGGAVKYIQGNIAGERASTWAVDLGAKKALSKLPVSIGLSVKNLGPGLKYMTQRDDLPLSVNAGLSVMALPGVMMSVGVNRLVNDKKTVLSAGTEYAMMTGGGLGLALRGGYGLTEANTDGGKNGLSVGAGVMALGAQLDYAVTPETGLGSVQRITLKKKF